MATLYISEFRATGPDRNGFLRPVMRLPPIAERTVSISGTSAKSAALNADTAFVRIISDSVCSILVGTDPTATTSLMRLSADSAEYFEVVRGAKIAVISNT